MCKTVRNNNEAHNFLNVKIFDDNWDLEEERDFVVTNSFLYVFGLIGDVGNAFFGWLIISVSCISIPVKLNESGYDIV